MAGPGLFSHTFEGPQWPHVGSWGPRPLAPVLARSHTPCIFACPSVLLPFHVGGPTPEGGRKTEGKDPKAFPVCYSMQINTTCIPPAWPPGAAEPSF